MLAHRPRHTNSTRLGKSLQPGRNIHCISEQVFSLHYDIADVDPDAKPHLLMGRSTRVRFGNGILHVDSTLHGVHGAGEIGDKAIASRVEDPASMRGNQAINNHLVCREGPKGANLVAPHEAAVALHIGSEDRRELLFDGVRFRGSAPPDESIARLSARSESFNQF